MQSNTRKRQRLVNHRHLSATTAGAAVTTRLSSTSALIDSLSDKTVTETSQKLRRTSSSSASAFTTTTDTSFNDPDTADVILHLSVDTTAPFSDDADSISVSSLDNNQSDDVQIYLHSHVLTRAKYFSALLSDRWRHKGGNKTDSNTENLTSVKLTVPPGENSINNHLTVLELLYKDDFTEVITSPSIALDILPVALALLFEDCVKNCVKFLEAVPWSEEEENRVVNLIPLLNKEESDVLLARVRVRVSPDEDKDNNSCEEMLYGLVLSAIHNHPNTAFVKAFVAKLLRDFSNKESARVVLDRAFQESLKVVKESLEEYSSPDFRGGDYDETEAIQRVNLHTAMTNLKHLMWLIERMIELKVAENAVKEWSEQSGFTGDLQRAFRDEARRNMVPGLPVVVLRCTAKMATAVAAGSILAARQVRMKLVKHWLPILIVCKDIISPMAPSHKSLYLELEETFLKIISTLPMSDAQALLQQCLSFSTRNIEDCPHLVNAFNTWFRRAMRPPQGDLF